MKIPIRWPFLEGQASFYTAEVLLPRLAASHRAQPFATHGRADGEAAEVGAGMSGGDFSNMNRFFILPSGKLT